MIHFLLLGFTALIRPDMIQAQRDCSSLLYEMDVKHYSIQLNINPAIENIHGVCEISFISAPNDSFVLDFMALQVDSVHFSDNNAPFLRVNFRQEAETLHVFNPTKNAVLGRLRVFYSGRPVKDGTWGGFYFSGDYAYNLGVGFDAEPHNFGRVWFPCRDNFCDRATYDFAITTPLHLKAVCNGEFDGADTSSEGITWRYSLGKTIPTYLASVAVGPYVQAIPEDDQGFRLRLHCHPSDSANMLSSFVHLPDALRIFEEHYGPHPFDIAGYNLVPFNAGAMEHATNIAYPIYAVSGGGLQYETLMAHELAHHWWGNHRTTESASQMWLNEGWASYSEHLFLEKKYGRKWYDDAVAEDHKNILHYAHLQDGEALPVSDVGHANTYGMHVYKKGADMIHVLRHVLGDSMFFLRIKNLMQESSSTISTNQVTGYFSSYTDDSLSKVVNSHFFRERIKQAGYPHFSVYEMKNNRVGGDWLLAFQLKQRVKHRDDLYHNVPVPYKVLFADGSMSERHLIIVSDEVSTHKQLFDKEPIQLWIDPDREMSFAVSDYTIHFKDTSWMTANPSNDPQFFVIENSSSNTDEVLMRINHHWVSPDHTFNNHEGIVLSRQRYFSIEGKWKEGNQYTLRFTYNGTTPEGNYRAGWLDEDLIRHSEDSLLIMYRPNQTSQWQIWEDVDWIRGSLFDKRGIARIRSLLPGEYSLAIRKHDFFASTPAPEERASAFTVYPNPADKQLFVKFETSNHQRTLEVTDELGRLLQSRTIEPGVSMLQLDVSGWAQGRYYIGLQMGQHLYEPKMLFIRH